MSLIRRNTLGVLNSRGNILITVLVFSTIAITVTVGLVNWGAALLSSIRNLQQREQAFQIAEAGIDYYRWHLAHAQSDFQDGTGTAGPYLHTFTDKDGVTIGTFSLVITPPLVGSTITKITSTGKVTANPAITRKVEAWLAIPSLAKYAVVANDNMYFGTGTEVYGPIHSNKGIHFDGIAHNIVTSAVATYVDPDVSQTKHGIYTTSGTDDPNPPTALPTRSDVFMAGRQLPVPAVDFSGLTTNLSQLKTLAQAGSTYWAASGFLGYHIVLKTNDTFDLYKVKTLQAAPSGCTNSATQWGTWSIKTPLTSSSNQTLVGNYAFPANGVVFIEDHVWVDGQISGARLTIAAAKIGSTDPTQYSNITINSDLLYSAYDGTDSIGLIAQGNINAGLSSANVMRIDAALVAQNGRVGRFYYSSSCSTGYQRSTITLYGMIATNVRYGFAYTDDTGYDIRNIIYDGNLLYGPPPSFPLASSQYQTISWKELK